MDNLYLIAKDESVVERKILIEKEVKVKNKDHVNQIFNEHILDASLHSFDPNKSSPPNDFFVKSFLRLKHY